MKVGFQVDGDSASKIQEMVLGVFASQELSPQLDIPDIGVRRGDLCNAIVACTRSLTAIAAYPKRQLRFKKCK